MPTPNHSPIRRPRPSAYPGTSRDFLDTASRRSRAVTHRPGDRYPTPLSQNRTTAQWCETCADGSGQPTPDIEECEQRKINCHIRVCLQAGFPEEEYEPLYEKHQTRGLTWNGHQELARRRGGQQPPGDRQPPDVHGLPAAPEPESRQRRNESGESAGRRGRQTQ